MRANLLFLAFLIATPAFAATLSPVAQKEIAYLFSHMENSGCEFNRNSDWHVAADASMHLKNKYAYLLRFNLLSSAESFIVGAATQSSITSQAYLVRCPGAPVVESGIWFKSVLEKYRQTHPKPTP